MSGQFQITNVGSAGGQATASTRIPTSGTGIVPRITSLAASVEGTGAGIGHLVVRDGAHNSGTVIWQENLIIVANGGATFETDSIDLRASPGNALTIEFTSGVTSALETVNAQGDYVPLGYPNGGP